MQIQFIVLNQENRHILSEAKDSYFVDKFLILPESWDTQNGLWIFYGMQWYTNYPHWDTLCAAITHLLWYFQSFFVMAWFQANTYHCWTPQYNKKLGFYLLKGWWIYNRKDKIFLGTGGGKKIFVLKTHRGSSDALGLLCCLRKNQYSQQ